MNKRAVQSAESTLSHEQAEMRELSEGELSEVAGGDLYTYVWVYWVGYESAYAADIQPRSAQK